MDTSKGSGSRAHLHTLFYIFMAIASVNLLVIVYHFISNIVLECESSTVAILLTTVICIPLELIIILIAVFFYLITKKYAYGLWPMVIINLVILLFTTSLLFIPSNDWSDKKKQEFLDQQYQSGIVNDLTVIFMGFSIPEMEQIFIKQIHDGEIVATFCIQPVISQQDSTLFYSKIDHVNIYDTYQFNISAQTFILSELKLGLKPRPSMLNMDYGCVIDGYKINDSIFQNSNFIEFRK